MGIAFHLGFTIFQLQLRKPFSTLNVEAQVSVFLPVLWGSSLPSYHLIIQLSGDPTSSPPLLTPNHKRTTIQ